MKTTHLRPQRSPATKEVPCPDRRKLILLQIQQQQQQQQTKSQ